MPRAVGARGRGQGGAPAAQRGRTTLRPNGGPPHTWSAEGARRGFGISRHVLSPICVAAERVRGPAASLTRKSECVTVKPQLTDLASARFAPCARQGLEIEGERARRFSRMRDVPEGDQRTYLGPRTTVRRHDEGWGARRAGLWK